MILLPEDFHVVRLTMVQYIMQKCCAKKTTTILRFSTASKWYDSGLTFELYDMIQCFCAKTTTSLPMFNTTCVEHHSCLITHGDKIRNSLVRCNRYHMKVDRRQNFAPNVSTKYLLREESNMIRPIVDDIMPT